MRLIDLICVTALVLSLSHSADAQTADFPASDNLSGYVHWITLYDADNQKIDPAAENPKPYSPEQTCKRCHDWQSISHGWHFNAVDSNSPDGRPGQPWIWSDERTGTHLPLSYRDWHGSWNPDELGLSRWQMAEKFGGYLPGGGPGSQDALAEALAILSNEPPEGYEDRASVTGPLPIDCMICHRAEGAGYSPFVWTEQIEEQNFAYAPTAALGIGTVKGSMTRLKDDFDPADPQNASKLPTVTYEPTKFRSDGKVFMDLVRKPSNNSCYYCHSNVTQDAVVDTRWVHDEDIHVRAGVDCADCHRNGIGHHTVRGFEGETHPSETSIASLSCQGCHMPNTDGDELTRSGRLGAPMPQHKGLPPVHFEAMTCTACHSGTLPDKDVPRQLNSIVHHLGHHLRRTGDELPGILGPALLRVDEQWRTSIHEDFDDQNARYAPHRMMWPSYWAVIENGEPTVLNPAAVYDVIRRPLKVRRNFQLELGGVRLSSSVLKELLGEDRYKTPAEERTPEENSKVAEAEAAALEEQVNERMAGALEAIEKEYPGSQAAFVSAGEAFIRDGEDAIVSVAPSELGLDAQPTTWPLAHNVRSAQQSLGITGCQECHSNDSLVFKADVTPVAILPGQQPASMSLQQLQGGEVAKLGLWNELFAGRSMFKVTGLIALTLTVLVMLIAAANQIRFGKPSSTVEQTD